MIAAGLVALGAPGAVIGLWALLAPRSFYDAFPGAGVHWVDRAGPYSEHLVTDYGALTLALATVTLLAARSLRRELVVAALVAQLVVGLPHNLFHVTHLDGFPASDAIAQTVLLGAQLALAVALLLASGESRWPFSTNRRLGQRIR